MNLAAIAARASRLWRQVSESETLLSSCRLCFKIYPYLWSCKWAPSLLSCLHMVSVIQFLINLTSYPLLCDFNSAEWQQHPQAKS